MTSIYVDQEVADLAQWEDEQIEYIKEKVTDDGRQEDLKKGKDPLQVHEYQIISFMIKERCEYEN